jgi:hypothetical protein
MPMAEQVLGLYEEKYFDLKVRHFHEKVGAEHAIDGSRHRWFQGERWYDLLVILDDATSEIYYAQLVEEESTRTVLYGQGAPAPGRDVELALRAPGSGTVQRGRRGFEELTCGTTGCGNDGGGSSLTKTGHFTCYENRTF